MISNIDAKLLIQNNMDIQALCHIFGMNLHHLCEDPRPDTTSAELKFADPPIHRFSSRCSLARVLRVVEQALAGIHRLRRGHMRGRPAEATVRAGFSPESQ